MERHSARSTLLPNTTLYRSPLRSGPLRRWKSMMTNPVRMPDEHGFTLIEVIVAMAVILVGVLGTVTLLDRANRSEEHTSELQSRHISYAAFCLIKKTYYLDL